MWLVLLISATFLWEGFDCVLRGMETEWVLCTMDLWMPLFNSTPAVSALTSVVPWDRMKQERWVRPKSPTSTRWSCKAVSRTQLFVRMMMIHLMPQALESSRPPACPSPGRRRTSTLRSSRTLGCPKRSWCYTPEKPATAYLERLFFGWSSHAPWPLLSWPLWSWRCHLDAWAGGSCLRSIKFIHDHSKIQMLTVLEISKVIFDP